MSNQSRYSRQIALPEIGIKGQKKLQNSSILVVGAGGLGCPALLYLAAAGIGTIGIIDYDTVDTSNLQRQILYSSQQNGHLKVHAAQENLQALNPDITINIYTDRLIKTNALNIIEQYDVIIDGTDNFEAKYLINDAAAILGKPAVYGAILGFEGQVSVFWAKKGPCYRCLHPKPPSAYTPNCAEAGVMGALAGMIGAAQAMEAIKIIVNHSDLVPLIGKLWLTDTSSMRTDRFTIPKLGNCPVCSISPDKIVLEEGVLSCNAFDEIHCAQAKDLKDAVFIDVRDLNEWQDGHIDKALHIPLAELLLMNEIDLSKDTPCIVYCQAGKRGQKAGAHLIASGYSNVKNLKGGYSAWCQTA